MSRPPASVRSAVRGSGRSSGGLSTRDRGAAAVEFALVAPLLLTLAVGITEFGRAYTTQAALAQAAREGATTLAMGGTTAEARTAAQDAATNLGVATTDITVPTGTCVGTAVGSSVTVKVRRPQVFLTGMFGTSVTLSGTAVMWCQG